MKRAVGTTTAVGLQKVTVLLRHATILCEKEFPNIIAPIEVIQKGVIDCRFSETRPIDFTQIKGFRNRDFLFLAKIKIRPERFPLTENPTIWVLFSPRRWRIRFSDNLQLELKDWIEVVRETWSEVDTSGPGYIRPRWKKVTRFQVIRQNE